MRLLFFLAVWKRPEITEVCFMGLNRLKNTGLFPMDTLAVISEVEMIPLCIKYGINYVVYKNQPLGEKKNFGLTKAFEREWDYLVELGSDDLLKNEYLEIITPHLGKYDVLGIDHVNYINSETGECRRMQTKTHFGLGRVMSRKKLSECAKGVPVLAKDGLISPGRTVAAGEIGFFIKESAEQLQKAGLADIVGDECYKIWDDKQNASLDNRSMFFMAVHGMGLKRIPCENAIGIDIKSRENIWPYNPELGSSDDLGKVLEGLSIEEQVAILNIIKANKAKQVEYAVA